MAKLSLILVRLNVVPSPEEYRKRAKESRKQANACRNEWERQGLLIIAEQCERLAAYKDLTGRSVPAKHRSRMTSKSAATLGERSRRRLPSNSDHRDARCAWGLMEEAPADLFNLGADRCGAAPWRPWVRASV